MTFQQQNNNNVLRCTRCVYFQF